MSSSQPPVPPFLNQTSDNEQPKSESPQPVKLLSVEPIHLKFRLTEALSSKANIHISNITQKRVAWRLRSNAPTRYVVNPACGFLTSGEAVIVSVELTNTNKYNPRQKFLVQAMEAKDDEKDRRRVWEAERAQNLENLHCVRVYSVADSKIQIPTKSSTSVSTAESASKTSVSTGVSFSPSESETSESSAASTGSSKMSEVSGTSTASTESFDDLIQQLTAEVKQNFAVKSEASKKMIEVFNEVKKAEVELDRVGVQCNHLNAQVNTLTAQITALSERSTDLEVQIKSLNTKL
ncbi:unnamed protein product [Bursaphelenchus okinawaensis]|uniref:Major sperm protein n=1 Tax=Bursaphelenchus okinawaensis TaxID=465554 RepID=A0A811LLQ2_9BILA|nr:unnamed protein product [Bursaphelenchus okinawaensis]CAG9125968.1 unnamed protein product [Bursaphelenchus okinawaensis]